MIVFFDTSVLVRCYFTETGTAEALALWSQAHTRVGSVLLGAEMLATFARKRRENPAHAPAIDTQQAAFLRHWQSMDRVNLSPALLPILTRLHAVHGLRGADSLHLAAALLYQHHAGEPITFACADDALIAAADAEGLEIERRTRYLVAMKHVNGNKWLSYCCCGQSRYASRHGTRLIRSRRGGRRTDTMRKG